jgi:hypothetical protein
LRVGDYAAKMALFEALTASMADAWSYNLGSRAALTSESHSRCRLWLH